ncbi:UNVERIFIED_CONTAM: hypothetical protein NCL1_47652 [Trichonephila clavipes]
MFYFLINELVQRAGTSAGMLLMYQCCTNSIQNFNTYVTNLYGLKLRSPIVDLESKCIIIAFSTLLIILNDKNCNT